VSKFETTPIPFVTLNFVGSPFADIDVRVKRLEEDYTVTKENMRQLRIFAGVILTFIFGYILFLISR